MLSRQHRQRGQDLIEYAVVLPVLLLLALGIVNFGLVIFSFNTISDAARQGTRYGVIGERATRDTAGILNAAYEVTDAARLNRARLTITTTKPSIDTVRVDVTYQMDLIAWIAGSPSIPLRAASTRRIEVE